MNFPSPQKDYTVLVMTLTYNHASFIEDTLKGIVMQQTNFPVVACVLDDCSTDGTADIIRRYEQQYPDLIKGFYFSENQYSQGKFTGYALEPWIKKAKYIAECEGDDYWTDPLKLQKQVDFMESHADCTLSFHRVMEHWQDGNAPDKVFFPVEDRVYTGVDIFKQWVVATASVMIRMAVLQSNQLLNILRNKGLMYYDQAIYTYCSAIGKAVGMSDVMGVYRRVNSGYTLQMWNGLDNSADVAWKCCVHNATMAELFEDTLGKEFKRAAIDKFLGIAMLSVVKSARALDVRHAFFFLRKSFSYYPKETLGWIFSLMKKQFSKLKSVA